MNVTVNLNVLAATAKTEGRKGDIAQKKSCLGLIKA